MNISQRDWEQAQSQLDNMDPEAMRRQAQQLKTMDKSFIRRMNPQFANMSDAQIDMVATQMEQMASSPAMMQMAQNQMRQMTPQQVEAQMKAVGGPSRRLRVGATVELKGLKGAAEHNGKVGTVVGYQKDRCKVKLSGEDKTLALKEDNLAAIRNAGDDDDDDDVVPTPAAPTMMDPALAAQQMDNPEVLKQQARHLRAMDPDAVRRANPQMAHMTDEQIKFSADQLEFMANNPAMLELAKQQMQNMSPEQLRAMQAAHAGSGAPSAGTPPPHAAPPRPGGEPSMPPPGQPPSMEAAAKMMENMDPSQLESMLDVVKQNPEMLKSVLKSNPMFAGMADDTVDKQLDMLDKIDPKQLQKYVGYAVKAQKAFAPAVKVYARADKALGGRLKHILRGAALAFVALLATRALSWLSFRLFGFRLLPAGGLLSGVFSSGRPGATAEVGAGEEEDSLGVETIHDVAAAVHDTVKAAVVDAEDGEFN